MNRQLETALHFASGDAAQLKALARQESSRAELLLKVLVAVLRKSGPVQVMQTEIDAERGGFEITPVVQDMRVRTDGKTVFSIPSLLVEIRATTI